MEHAISPSFEAWRKSGPHRLTLHPERPVRNSKGDPDACRGERILTLCPSQKVFLAVVAGLLLFSGCGRSGPPYSPREALKKFQLADGFRIELAASEPAVADPIAIAFDERGRMFVVEMGDYPLSAEPKGQIRLLEDRDGDGIFEHSTVFVDRLHFPHGVLPWRGGIVVTCAPDIFYFADTDGDGKADVRKVLLTGFAEVNPQLRVNTPLYGIDNWIYAAYPKFGGGVRFKQFSKFGEPIHFPDHPEVPPVDIFSKGMDLRFKPDQLKLEAVSGNSEYGLTFDARGHRFASWNDKHVEHAVIESRYLARNPYLAAGSAVQLASDHGDSAELYPITENPILRQIREPAAMSQLGHFTSACGQSVYTGGSFPPEYDGAYFICEPVHNLVHSDRLTPHGATFVASRLREKAEFLASKDAWFMPVFTTVGPDGALYVVDFYRKIVEHPEWIRKDLMNAQKLFDAGSDRGRIYRIVREGSKPAPRPKLNEATAAELVQQLSNPNMWWRTTAQRLLIERRDKTAVAPLRTLASTGAVPQGRMHALWTLEGLNALDPKFLWQAMSDRSPVVREQAVRIAEAHLDDAAIAARLAQMTSDPDDQVQFQVACTLGQLPPVKSFEPLKQIAFRHLSDPWFQIAVLTSASENADRWFTATAGDSRFTATISEGKVTFLKRIAGILGAWQKNSEIAGFLTLVSRKPQADESWWRIASLQGLADGMRRGSSGRMQLTSNVQCMILTLVESPSPSLSNAALEVASSGQLADSMQLRSMLQKASKLVRTNTNPVLRANAASVLGLDPTASTLPLLAELMTPQQPEEVRFAVARALLEMPEPKSTELLLSSWPTYTASVRELVIAGFFRQPSRLIALLDAIEKGTVQAASLSRSTRQKLIRSRDESIRKRSENLLANVGSNRAAIIEKYRSATEMAGNAQRGLEVFRKNCSDCHQIGKIGVKLGPDLATVANQSKEELLTNILDPNANIAPGYEEYMIQTTDGKLITGVIANQSATSVTLRRRKGEEDTVLRSNISELRALTVSSMPEDLEEGFTVSELGDLLEFLKNQGNTKTAGIQKYAN